MLVLRSAGFFQPIENGGPGVLRSNPCRSENSVHVAAAAVIESTLPQHGNGTGAIFQLVSTGIVHTPPPAMAVYFMEKFGAGEEIIEYGVRARMLPIGFKGHFLVPERNWLSLEPDERGRIWANWHVEGHEYLLTQVIDPVVLPGVV
jgi:hypothetical protein